MKPCLMFGVFVLALIAAACTPTGDGFGIRLEDFDAARRADGLDIRARQRIELSGEAGRALRHGVPLRLRLDVALRAPGRWTAFDERSLSYEIRYLPLSDHYQLTGPGADGPSRTYPRLRHVLADLGEVEMRLDLAPAPPARFEVRMRSRLDRSGLPGPMQLPALLSPQWAHDSGWLSKEIDFGG